METLDFLHHIDEPPTLLLWRMDDLMALVLALVAGILAGQPTIALVLGAMLSHGYRRFRDRQADGYALHLNLSVSPGTTVLIEIAIGHLNRIATPFADPAVHTVSNASTQVDGSVVDVATDTEDPMAATATAPGQRMSRTWSSSCVRWRRVGCPKVLGSRRDRAEQSCGVPRG